MKPLSLGARLLASSTCLLDGPVAHIESGPIVGTRVELPGAVSAVNKFYGIPFAKPPERFGLPEAPEPWSEPRNATEYGPACLQFYVQNPLTPGLDVMRDLWGEPPPESEDCLYVNAFAPTTPSPVGGRPVLLFIPGGGFQQSHGRIDLSGFAAYEDIVVFTFNYRLNVFGFPNSPDIPLEERNLGLHDQRLAIEWMQANAAAFGGDPEKVTIMGNSAGALSVDAHLNAYAGVGTVPFRGAILLSGQVSWGLLGSTPSVESADAWNSLADGVGCSVEPGQEQMQCMKEANATLMTETMNEIGLVFNVMRDNVTLPTGTAARWRDGVDVVKVPLMMGTVAQEGRSLVNRDVPLEFFMAAYFPEPLVTQEQKDEILDFYRALPGIESDYDLASAIYTDYFWQCPQDIMARTSASIGNPTWKYYFNTSVIDILSEDYAFLGKCHGSDALLLFITPTIEGDASGIPLTPQLYTLASNFRAAIGRFVKNPEGGPGWPAVGSKYSPFDVANLGDVGNETPGWVTVVNQTELDKRCGLYEDIYPLLEEYVL